MKLSFSDIEGSHKNHPCLVIAHGPSLNTHLPKMEEYRQKNVVLIDCNDWDNFHNIIPDYVVYANNIETMLKNCSRVNRWNTTIVYADSVDLTPRRWIDEHITCDFLPYDQRHFLQKDCGSGVRCCGRILERLTIQEELQRYSSFKEHYGSGDTVSVHMLAFAVLLGCDPIYVTGLDLDYTQGYAESKAKLRIPSKGELNNYLERILKDLKVINESAKMKNQRIINLNKRAFFDELEKGEMKL